MYKVWNADAAKWVLNGLRMCRKSANRIACAVEADTGDMCMVVPA